MRTQFTRLIVLVALALPLASMAQTAINKTLPVQSGQSILMHFDYPELIKVSTWDKNEILITGSVSINSGENDDAFELITSTSGNTISIRNEIKNMKSLPHRITIIDGSNKMVFKNKEEFKKYENEHGKRKYDVQSWGVDMDILIEIKVPKNMDTKVECVYGMVEIKDFVGPLEVEATYGGVDAALVEKNVGEVVAETNYGDIFTNLDTKFGGESSKNEAFHTLVSAKPGKGPKYIFDSKYGNVYLRKAPN
jgi:hypothetical protein